jgi:hypothetical protein
LSLLYDGESDIDALLTIMSGAEAYELVPVVVQSPPATSAASSSGRTSSTGASARIVFNAGSRSPFSSCETYG